VHCQPVLLLTSKLQISFLAVPCCPLPSVWLLALLSCPGSRSSTGACLHFVVRLNKVYLQMCIHIYYKLYIYTYLYIHNYICSINSIRRNDMRRLSFSFLSHHCDIQVAKQVRKRPRHKLVVRAAWSLSWSDLILSISSLHAAVKCKVWRMNVRISKLDCNRRLVTSLIKTTSLLHNKKILKPPKREICLYSVQTRVETEPCL
jgi:hypothetical protein